MSDHTNEIPLNENDLNDIGQWPVLTTQIRDQIIKNGPCKIVGPDSRFPVDTPKDCGSKSSRIRKFSLFHCTRKLPNNEASYRTWLQYSDKTNRVFCFCCLLFGNNRSQLGQSGINNWKHIGKYLMQHETSSEHFICYGKWRDAEKNLLGNKGIDSELQAAIQKEAEHWKGVLE